MTEFPWLGGGYWQNRQLCRPTCSTLHTTWAFVTEGSFLPIILIDRLTEPEVKFRRIEFRLFSGPFQNNESFVLTKSQMFRFPYV